jgi:hypothetical protein
MANWPAPGDGAVATLDPSPVVEPARAVYGLASALFDLVYGDSNARGFRCVCSTQFEQPGALIVGDSDDFDAEIAELIKRHPELDAELLEYVYSEELAEGNPGYVYGPDIRHAEQIIAAFMPWYIANVHAPFHRDDWLDRLDADAFDMYTGKAEESVGMTFDSTGEAETVVLPVNVFLHIMMELLSLLEMRYETLTEAATESGESRDEIVAEYGADMRDNWLLQIEEHMAMDAARQMWEEHHGPPGDP